jgi:hypothetical protein
VNGSTSGGLAQSSDDEARRERTAGAGGANGGPPGGGPGSSQTLGLPPGMSAPGSDALGLGGFGASGNGGFGQGPGGGGQGPGAGRGGGGGGRGFGGGGGGGNRNNDRRGPYNGQYSSFGNRRRSQPTYTGSVFMRLQNSALNAAPYSLNGQRRAEALLCHRQLWPERGRPSQHSQDPALPARLLLSDLPGNSEPQSL